MQGFSVSEPQFPHLPGENYSPLHPKPHVKKRSKDVYQSCFADFPAREVLTTAGDRREPTFGTGLSPTGPVLATLTHASSHAG